MNRARRAAGQRPANAIWLWGQGKAPTVPKFADVHGLTGAIISAVDLVRGVGVLAGWTRIDVPGATGYLDTDYAAKGAAAIGALEDFDLVCVHVEAPDEASHEGRAEAKVEALERIDRDIVGPVRQALEDSRSLADLDLARSLDPAPHPGPRPRAGRLGDGGARACRPRANVRRVVRPASRAVRRSTRATG